MIKLAIGGYKGRMGQRLIALAQGDQRFEITACYDRDGGDGGGGGDAFHVLIDFSMPDGTMAFLNLCKDSNSALVTGTTGFSPEQQQHLQDVAGHVPIMHASNFSIGINFLLDVLPQVTKELSKNFDIEILETHHTRKVDAPSGTALSIRDTILEATERRQDDAVVYGRHGQPGSKPQAQIGMHSIRSGDVIGRHSIVFGGTGESITITHEAHSRDTFAKGALEAAAWIVGKKPGLYSMKDLLTDRL